jgi:hypothetical protein
MLLRPGVDSARAADLESASFALRGSNGFAVDVSSQGGEVTVIASEYRPPIATFTATGRPRAAGTRNGASSIYSAPSTAAAAGKVDASLGSLGYIAVHFRPSGRRAVSTLRRACGPPIRVVRRLGTFTGTIRFEGEEGYTTVAATRAKGSVGTPLPAGCDATASASALSSPDGALLTAVEPVAGSSFRAATGPGGVDFRARVEERNADGIAVVRRAYAGAPLSAFPFDSALCWATVTPPAPFSGGAHFVSGAAGDEWRGPLRVTFPGLSVPLTGPGFRSELVRR